MAKSITKSALIPLVMIWLAAHAVLLALILGAKFLFTKTVLLVLLMMGTAAFLLSRFSAKRRRLLIAP
jgi:hypothetical protein